MSTPASAKAPADFLPDAKIANSCAHGDVTSHPLADIEVVLDQQPLEVRAVVSITFPHPVYLGSDRFGGTDILRERFQLIINSPDKIDSSHKAFVN